MTIYHIILGQFMLKLLASDTASQEDCMVNGVLAGCMYKRIGVIFFFFIPLMFFQKNCHWGFQLTFIDRQRTRGHAYAQKSQIISLTILKRFVGKIASKA